jgi:hypothetical protein
MDTNGILVGEGRNGVVEWWRVCMGFNAETQRRRGTSERLSKSRSKSKSKKILEEVLEDGSVGR